ncbi:hypothetical protein FSPOR_6487 [Fusarium sporotrichioides]|uniref:Uncharacterized protein n=1 Tax=Fusarium sporotrichioides TaxID=5514 RepID=A0A395S3C1_FUSSP|nr:hypothetical protein FSPOR_6487 [Fusarium sporotrichioides]
MCGTDTLDDICGVDFQSYINKRDAGTKPRIAFCNDFRGKGVDFLLTCAENPQTDKVQRENQPAGLADMVNASSVKFWDLAKLCAMKHKGHSKDYDRITIGA